MKDKLVARLGAAVSAMDLTPTLETAATTPTSTADLIAAVITPAEVRLPGPVDASSAP
jgi:hypothetical protein